MNNILLIVDLEEQYLTDDDYMGLLLPEFWKEARLELRQLYIEIIESIKVMKNEGWEIHFTGETTPYGDLIYIVDEYLPWWVDNKNLISNYYPCDKKIYICGIFRERCVQGVNYLIQNSEVIEDLCISHEIIGDEGFYSREHLI